MRTFFVRSYCALLAVVVMFHWLLDGAKTIPEFAQMGNSLGCIWRWAMANADYRLGLQPNPRQALKVRLDRTVFAKRRRARSVTWQEWWEPADREHLRKALAALKEIPFETKR